MTIAGQRLLQKLADKDGWELNVWGNNVIKKQGCHLYLVPGNYNNFTIVATEGGENGTVITSYLEAYKIRKEISKITKHLNAVIALEILETAFEPVTAPEPFPVVNPFGGMNYQQDWGPGAGNVLGAAMLGGGQPWLQGNPAAMPRYRDALALAGDNDMHEVHI